MNPFSAIQALTSPGKMLQQQLQSRMVQMQKQNPQAFQKMQEMVGGKSENDLKQTAMNLAKERGIDIKQFASNFGIQL